MWGWQAGATGATAVANNLPPHSHSGHPQELSDMMMQMLDQSAAAASFEDLNMFNTNFEWAIPSVSVVHYQLIY